MGKNGRLRNKIAVVTGAASGIGEAIANLFAEEGAGVALVDVQRQKGEVARERLSKTGDGFFVWADLAEASSARSVIPAVLAHFGGLDILVNNAGFYGWTNKKNVTETPEEVWDRTLNINLRSVFLLCRDAVPHMIQRGAGSIVNVASIGGLEAFPEFAAYSTSKGALVLLTKSLALDYGKHRIRANAICPGAIETPGAEQFMQDRASYTKMIATVTPLGHTGMPEDVAYAALYLASEESRYVTGTTLVVDGGRMAMA